MRILHVLCSSAWGGAERMACTIHRLCLAQGHESAILAADTAEVVAGLNKECSELMIVEGHASLGWGWIRAARARIREFSPDVLHVHLPTPGQGVLAWSVTGNRAAVFTFHLLPRNPRWSLDYLLPLRAARIFSLLEQFHAQHRLVAVSDADYQQLQQRYPKGNVRLAVNAPPLPPLRAEPAPPLEYPQATIRLLSVGRLETQKGFERLIIALSDERVKALNWHWALVGEGAERPRLQALVEQRGLTSKVTFVGARPAHALFSQAQLVICPSHFEGMPLVPLEARLARVPVLLSAIDSHREAFNGVPEAFLPEDDAEWPARLHALLTSSNAIEELLIAQQRQAQEDPRQRLWQDYARIYAELLPT